jgi:hypothetical protein
MKTTGKNMKSTCAQALIAAALACVVAFTTTVAQAAVRKWRDFQFGGV